MCVQQESCCSTHSGMGKRERKVCECEVSEEGSETLAETEAVASLSLTLFADRAAASAVAASHMSIDFVLQCLQLLFLSLSLSLSSILPFLPSFSFPPSIPSPSIPRSLYHSSLFCDVA